MLVVLTAAGLRRVSPQSEGGIRFPREVGPELWGPWQSQATQAPSKTLGATRSCSQRGGRCDLWD